MKKLLFSIGLVYLTSFSFSQNRSSGCEYICNEGFDSLYLTPTVVLVNSSALPCWKTTASDGKMEIWANGNSGVASYSGIQFLEINATMAAAVYQDIVVAPGTLLSIGFAHRGRGGVDTISVQVGPVGGPYTVLGYYGDSDVAWGYYTVNYVVPGPGTNYSVRFNAEYWGFGNVGVGNFLDAVSICNATSINDIESTGLISAFPNPAQLGATITFENFSGDNFTLTLFDNQGQLVESIANITKGEIEIKKNNLPNGLYFFKLSSNKKCITGKLIFTE